MADHTVILFTDGVPTTGNTNISSVVQGLTQNSQIVTHVITFGAEAASGTLQTSMQSARRRATACTSTLPRPPP